jgi:D-3-phosphoglycerate dehydrogenase
VGLGNLGAAVAKVGLAFNMKVLAWSANLTRERTEAVGVELATKEELFSQSDVVSIHYVLSDRSRGIVGAADLARMKPSAYFVNTSRGPLADEAALIEALENRRIAGAGLDVFDVEPLPIDHAFRRLNNVVLTPHIGYVTTDSYRVYYSDDIEDILAFLSGEPVRPL